MKTVSLEEKLGQAKKLIAQCPLAAQMLKHTLLLRSCSQGMKVLQKLKAFWAEVQEPVKRIMALVVEAGLERAGSEVLGKKPHVTHTCPGQQAGCRRPSQYRTWPAEMRANLNKHQKGRRSHFVVVIILLGLLLVHFDIL